MLICEGESEICCHKSHQLKTEKIMCSNVEKEGFSCVPNEECTDILGSHEDNSEIS